MAENSSMDELEALQGIITRLTPLDAPTRMRLLQTVATFFDMDFGPGGSPVQVRDCARSPSASTTPLFSEREEISPKEFLLQKEPRTDVERVACLAYYLTHLRNTPHFKTADITQLNTEAAQPRFANTAQSVENATKMGYLVPAIKGHKQLGAMGEQFVRALPDRDAAKEAITRLKPRRYKKRTSEPTGDNGSGMRPTAEEDVAGETGENNAHPA
jgi:hypothetical protein